MARAARIPLLYADGASKLQMEKDVKHAVWGTVDAIAAAQLAPDPRILAWDQTADYLKASVARLRMKFEDVEKNKGLSSWLDRRNRSRTRSGKRVRGVIRNAATSRALRRTLHRLQIPALPAQRVPALSRMWRQVAWQSSPMGVESRIASTSCRKGRLPPCANAVHVEEGGSGVGEQEARRRDRRLCKTCCRKFGLKPDAWLK